MSTAAVSTKLWRLPMTPAELRDITFFNHVPNSGLKLNTFRMVPLDLNAPDVVGYSACWSGRLMMLHAHKAGENLAFYKDLLAAYGRAVWIYIPMSPGERILEIWGRRGRLDGHMGLLVRFNCLLATCSLADNWKDEDKQGKAGRHWFSHITSSAAAKWRHSPNLDAAMCSSRGTQSPLPQPLTSRRPSAGYQGRGQSECYLVNAYTDAMSKNARNGRILLLCCISRGCGRGHAMQDQVGDPFTYERLDFSVCKWGAGMRR